ncbi:MAG: CHRD domain-containing protein [Candidatus Eremiobacteraeota bacterium]|nr:CHRD domain-containing protein [Candidatus Eremiobacteraeota bacterium]MBV8459330.1 CHRD domain-containing protein [Candidatus Eremiobacteraeota bacterium]
MSPSSVTVPMHEQNSSGESGAATLTQIGKDVKVVITLKGAPATTPQPAHIHEGTCGSIKGVVYALTNVVNGQSTTTGRNATVDSLLDGTHAINVHESADNLGKYVACGDIVKR